MSTGYTTVPLPTRTYRECQVVLQSREALRYISPGEFGEEIYSLRTLYVEGGPAPITHIHWRRFAVKNIPYADFDAFDQWLYERWDEKDELLEYFQRHGQFPASEIHVKARVEIRSKWELVQIFPSLFAVLVFGWVCRHASVQCFTFARIFLSSCRRFLDNTRA